jgi:hypothetical protein
LKKDPKRTKKKGPKKTFSEREGRFLSILENYKEKRRINVPILFLEPKNAPFFPPSLTMKT